MGGKIILRQTSMLRKQVGQMKKLLGLWKINPLKQEKQFPTQQAPIVSTGAPRLMPNALHLNSRYLVRRQSVLNRHLTELITDVISNQDIDKQLSDLDVRITSIETKAFNKGIDIYYATPRVDLENVAKDLMQFSPRIRKAMTDMQLIGRVPRINFIFDSASQLNVIMDRLLCEARKTLPNCPPTSLVLKSDVRSEINQTRRNQESVDDLDTNVGRKFYCPTDMTNTILGYDFATVYQKVLNGLPRSRASQSLEFRPSNDPMPPAEWTSPVFAPQPTEDSPDTVPDASTRLQLMKNFMINQRKKTETMARAKRKLEILKAESVKWEKIQEEPEPHEIYGEDALNDELVREG